MLLACDFFPRYTHLQCSSFRALLASPITDQLRLALVALSPSLLCLVKRRWGFNLAFFSF